MIERKLIFEFLTFLGVAGDMHDAHSEKKMGSWWLTMKQNEQIHSPNTNLPQVPHEIPLVRN